MKTALFVDFDNVYSGLRRLGGPYAKCFASQPALWMRWLVESLPLPSPAGAGGGRRAQAGAGGRRRILVRRRYPNPVVYSQFRRAFSQAGFGIVDCPPMTNAGKTGTDIHMVLDIMEALQHTTRYDEFMVFSADADFSPVLRKLRGDDRRTSVLAAGAVSAACEACADLMIKADEFICDALGFREGDAAPAEPPGGAMPVTGEADEAGVAGASIAIAAGRLLGGRSSRCARPLPQPPSRSRSPSWRSCSPSGSRACGSRAGQGRAPSLSCSNGCRCSR